jgi:hypothetical protein
MAAKQGPNVVFCKNEHLVRQRFLNKTRPPGGGPAPPDTNSHTQNLEAPKPGTQQPKNPKPSNPKTPEPNSPKP